MSGKFACPSLECHNKLRLGLLELETTEHELELTCLGKQKTLFCLENPEL